MEVPYRSSVRRYPSKVSHSGGRWPGARTSAGSGSQQRRRAPLADDLRRDPLPDVAFAVAIHEQAVAGLSLNVDEAGGDRQAGGVDLLRRALSLEVADPVDAFALDADVRATRRRAGSVDHAAAADDEVVLRPARSEDNDGQYREDGDRGGSLHVNDPPLIFLTALVHD